jgi:ABC-type lipoprotein export system ATPase subunit
MVVYKDHDLTSATEAELTEYRRTHVGFVFQFCTGRRRGAEARA